MIKEDKTSHKGPRKITFDPREGWVLFRPRRGVRVKRICVSYRGQFELRLSEDQKRTGKVCSRNCYRGSILAKRVSRQCLTCRKEFTVTPDVLKRGWGKYCSISCSGTAKSVRAKRACLTCRKAFALPPKRVCAVLTENRLKYCSLRCFSKTFDARSGPAFQAYQTTIQSLPMSLRFIQRVVTSHCGLEWRGFLDENRIPAIAHPRQIAMFLCRRFTGASLSEIARGFNRDNHTTVIHAVKRIESQRQQDRETARLIHALHRKVKAQITETA